MARFFRRCVPSVTAATAHPRPPTIPQRRYDLGPADHPDRSPSVPVVPVSLALDRAQDRWREGSFGRVLTAGRRRPDTDGRGPQRQRYPSAVAGSRGAHSKVQRAGRVCTAKARHHGAAVHDPSSTPLALAALGAERARALIRPLAQPAESGADRALQMRGTPALRRLPYFKIYRSRQDEVYNMLCKRVSVCASVGRKAWQTRRAPWLTLPVARWTVRWTARVLSGPRAVDDPGYNPDPEMDDDHSALDTFPVILLAAGYKGVGLRNDSPTLTELGRLKCCLEIQKPVPGAWADDQPVRRTVIGRDGRPVSAEIAGNVVFARRSSPRPPKSLRSCVTGRGGPSGTGCRPWARPSERLAKMEQRVRFAQEKKTALLLRKGQRMGQQKMAVLFGNDDAVRPSNSIANPLFRGSCRLAASARRWRCGAGGEAPAQAWLFPRAPMLGPIA